MVSDTISKYFKILTNGGAVKNCDITFYEAKN